MKERPWIISEEKSKSLLPYLRWIAESAPHIRHRRAAKSLLSKIRGIKDWKQVLVTKGEEDVVVAVYDAFPYEEIKEPEQLRLL